MVEHPILFKAPMVRAILTGQKTVTRRVVKARPDKSMGKSCVLQPHELAGEVNAGDYRNCPYGQPGDRLWVRETWQLHEKFTDNCVVVYRASERNSWTEFHRRFPVGISRGISEKPFQYGWRPSIHMPRWACRILLEITAVHIERLQDISEEQAIAEGIEPFTDFQPAGHWHRYRDGGMNSYVGSPIASYASLWTEINGTGAWEANPWVWVVEFKRVTP